jgi:hypothetical protein
MGGHAFLLPHNNIPETGVAGQQALSEATENFGLFQPLLTNQTEIDHGLRVQNFDEITGVDGAPLGQGVATTVLAFCFASTLHSPIRCNESLESCSHSLWNL